jgi:hypothetical protein
MSAQILPTGFGGAKFDAALHHGLKETKPKALGIAVAYVSVSGFKYIQNLVKKFEIKRLRLVTDTRDAITHPVALATALDHKWDVRVVDNLPGTFHPKLYIGGDAFHEDAGMTGTSLILAGSANLTAGGLYRNGECSYLSVAPSLGASAGIAWKECWGVGSPLTAPRLSAYEKYFALRNRYRLPADLVTLGVADEAIPTENGRPLKNVKPPTNDQRALSNTVATTAWAGLQSFTGDYNLQVEFPRDAGAVLSRLLGTVSVGKTANLLCEDGITRPFIFRFYAKNGMFRLNVHNDTPDASWAREHKEGIAAVEADHNGVIRFRIIKPGRELFEIVDRSLALGTWGRTSTRLYGWY